MMYASWDMDCNRQIFLSFWDIFCSFTPSHSPHLTIKKIEKNKKKRKKSPIDIILLHVCTINEDYMMHGSWDKRCNRQEIFGRFFALLPLPLTIQNMKILKKWIYYHFTHVFQKWRSYDVWFLRYGVLQT